MYQIFEPQPLSGGGVVLPDFRRVREGLQQSIARVIDYRHQNPMYLQSSHLFIRLLQNVNVSLNLELEAYVDKVTDLTYNLAMSMRLTSPMSMGRLFTEGVCYSKQGSSGSLIKEAFLVNTDDFDLEDFEVNWRRYESIRVLHHPGTNLWMTVPDGRQDGEGRGIATMAVNLPMLAAQYRMWRQERREIEARESSRTVGQFLMEVPLPNMLYSHGDVAVLNRLVALYQKRPMPQVKHHHPFVMYNWERPLDSILEMFLTNVPRKRWDFNTLIENLPTISHNSYHDVLRLPDMSYARQVQWIVILARLPLVVYLLAQNQTNENYRNKPALTRLRHYFRLTEHSRSLSSALPGGDYERVREQIEVSVLPYLQQSI